jgi:hypothetical protein
VRPPIGPTDGSRHAANSRRSTTNEPAVASRSPRSRRQTGQRTREPRSGRASPSLGPMTRPAPMRGRQAGTGGPPVRQAAGGPPVTVPTGRGDFPVYLPPLRPADPRRGGGNHGAGEPGIRAVRSSESRQDRRAVAGSPESPAARTLEWRSRVSTEVVVTIGVTSLGPDPRRLAPRGGHPGLADKGNVPPGTDKKRRSEVLSATISFGSATLRRAVMLYLCKRDL